MMNGSGCVAGCVHTCTQNTHPSMHVQLYQSQKKITKLRRQRLGNTERSRAKEQTKLCHSVDTPSLSTI